MRITFITFLSLTLFRISNSPVYSQNDAPVVKSLKVIVNEQGEEGVIQTIIRASAFDTEDGEQLYYE